MKSPVLNSQILRSRIACILSSAPSPSQQGGYSSFSVWPSRLPCPLIECDCPASCGSPDELGARPAYQYFACSWLVGIKNGWFSVPSSALCRASASLVSDTEVGISSCGSGRAGTKGLAWSNPRPRPCVDSSTGVSSSSEGYQHSDINNVDPFVSIGAQMSLIQPHSWR